MNVEGPDVASHGFSSRMRTRQSVRKIGARALHTNPPLISITVVLAALTMNLDTPTCVNTFAIS